MARRYTSIAACDGGTLGCLYEDWYREGGQQGKGESHVDFLSD